MGLMVKWVVDCKSGRRKCFAAEVQEVVYNDRSSVRCECWYSSGRLSPHIWKSFTRIGFELKLTAYESVAQLLTGTEPTMYL